MSKQECPYENETPEWQLWQGIQSHRTAMISKLADAERSTNAAHRSRMKVEEYEAALFKLDPTYSVKRLERGGASAATSAAHNS